MSALGDPPNLGAIYQVLYNVFTTERVGLVTIHGWHLTFTVKTQKYYRVRLDEVEKLAKDFGVDAQMVEFWNVRDGVEFFVDLDAATPIESPRARRNT